MNIRPIHDIPFAELIELEPHGPDTFVGIAAEYPWGGRLFGGQVIAQALAAAARTVPADRHAHSLHSYFIRAGSPNEPVRCEVERLRDGRSFTTRQVVVRQSSGAILNASVSFQAVEEGADVTPIRLPDDVPPPDSDDVLIEDDSWGDLLDRRRVVRPGAVTVGGETIDGVGSWVRLLADLPDDPVLHACGFAFMSDAAPFGPVRWLHPLTQELLARGESADRDLFVGASLDHSIWFHRPLVATDWMYFDTVAHGLSGNRGLSTGNVLTIDGTHVATIAQEVLQRVKR